MKNLLTITTFLLVSTHSFANFSVNLADGAQLISKSYETGKVYNDLLVKKDGKEYTICRLHTSTKTMQQLLCNQRARPFIDSTSKSNRYLSLFSARINRDLSVDLIQCRREFIYARTYCRAKPSQF